MSSTYDLGDDVLTTLEVTDSTGTLVAAASVVLSVTDPSGNTSAPSVSNPSTGNYEAVVSTAEAGRWRYTWTTTGPAGVEHGWFDVQAAPPATPEPLATIDDLEARIGTLTAAQAARAPALLVDASALVRIEARGQTINRVTDDSVVLRPIGNAIRLPQLPVISVTSVAAIDREGGADLTLSDWAFDGIDRIDLTGAYPTTDQVISWWNRVDLHTNTYRVVYTHGTEQTPDFVRAVVCNMVNRVLTSPSMTEGIAQTNIGAYGQQFQQGTGSAGVAVRMFDSDRQMLIAGGLRSMSATVMTNVR